MCGLCEYALGLSIACLWFLAETIANSSSLVSNFLLCDFVNIEPQKMGWLNSPRVLSHSKTWPGLLILSAPETRITSARPDAMYEYADITAFEPELHRCSTVWAIFGLIPVNSDSIALRYFELSLVETMTPSIKFCDRFLVVSKICFVDSRSKVSTGISSFVKLLLPDPTTATFLNLIPLKM